MKRDTMENYPSQIKKYIMKYLRNYEKDIKICDVTETVGISK